jgi:hypothetical protein
MAAKVEEARRPMDGQGMAHGSATFQGRLSSRPAMPEHKYRFNPQTLNFERIRLSAGRR